MGKMGGSVCEINVWREVKMDEGGDRQSSYFSEVESVLIKTSRIPLSGHIKV